jgi:DNA-binding transcriptional ArsR family regulator
MTEEDKADVFRGLACGLRRELLLRLGDGEKTATELLQGIDLTQPALSRHLRVLLDTDLVTCRAEGLHRYYKRNPATIKRAKQWLQKHT